MKTEVSIQFLVANISVANYAPFKFSVRIFITLYRKHLYINIGGIFIKFTTNI